MRTSSAFYRPTPKIYSAESKAMFAELKAGDTSMLVHCTAGEDRTGVGSALILTALGVPRSIIVSEHAMSEKHQQSTMRQQASRAKRPGQRRHRQGAA